MSYLEKLKAFNATDRYSYELAKVVGFLRKSDKVLDYGCGTGYAVNKLTAMGYNVKGYDATHYCPDFNYSSAIGRWDVVYFMHSFAHIAGIKEVLKALDTDKVIIVTPNKTWLDKNQTAEYKPDETVLKHYDVAGMLQLMSSAGFNKTKIETITNGERLLIIATK